MTDPTVRINALTTNARNTWFVLLGVLVFVSITLMGVQHIDFYGVDRQTDLPLVNVAVPTWLFFYAAPLLITVVYGYFQLYLIRLWDALGEAPTRVNGDRLGDAIAPWLVTDAALHLRARRRQDNCVAPRAMEWPATILNLLLAWIFGLGVLSWIWLESLAARDFVMTATAALGLLASLTIGYVSLRVMWRRMVLNDQSDVAQTARETALVAGLVFAAPVLLALSHGRTSGDLQVLATLDLTGKSIVEKPAGWLPYDIARKEFLAEWCRREAPACDAPAGQKPGLIKRIPSLLFGEKEPLITTDRSKPPAAFEAEWKLRREAERAALKKPRWSEPDPDATRPDFRDAYLYQVFLSGANLSGARMEGANLSGARMEGANLSGALREVDLRPAIFDTSTDWRNAFFDSSVKVPDGRRKQIGQPCLWTWIDQQDGPLSDEEFFGHWRGWLTLDPGWSDSFWFYFAPAEWRNVALLPPPPGCTWEHDPLPAAD